MLRPSLVNALFLLLFSSSHSSSLLINHVCRSRGLYRTAGVTSSRSFLDRERQSSKIFYLLQHICIQIRIGYVHLHSSAVRVSRRVSGGRRDRVKFQKRPFKSGSVNAMECRKKRIEKPGWRGVLLYYIEKSLRISIYSMQWKISHRVFKIVI